jgi:hypothetical protein
MAGGWFVLREKYCWLVADKPSEQGERSIERLYNAGHAYTPCHCHAGLKYFE